MSSSAGALVPKDPVSAEITPGLPTTIVASSQRRRRILLTVCCALKAVIAAVMGLAVAQDVEMAQ